MTPIQQLFLGTSSAVATKTYVDDCFYTHVYEGNSSTSGQNITGSDFTPDFFFQFKYNPYFLKTQNKIKSYITIHY